MGTAMPARIPITAITIRSSIRVIPLLGLILRIFRIPIMPYLFPPPSSSPWGRAMSGGMPFERIRLYRDANA
jgi:hypothetical protein